MQDDMNDPFVAIILLNWNSYHDSADCLESLKNISYENYEVFVVDNNSTDGSCKRLADEFPDSNFIFNDENEGFSGGINTGIGRASEQGADYFWLLNNDVIVTQECVLSNLVEKMENHLDLGIISPRIYEYPSEETIWFEKGKINRRTGSTDHVCRNQEKEELINTEYIPNCSSLIRRDVIEEVGLLPERYFFYYEDAAYCTRVIELDYGLATDTSSYLYHKSYASTEGAHGPTTTYYMTRNRVLFVDEFGKSGLLFLIFMMWYMTTRTLHRTATLNISAIIALIRGVLDGFREIDGKGPYP